MGSQPSKTTGAQSKPEVEARLRPCPFVLEGSDFAFLTRICPSISAPEVESWPLNILVELVR